MALSSLLDILGPPITDVEEESFLVFAQEIPSRNLGFVDRSRDKVQVVVGDREFTIWQSLGLLNSSREGGTTGAVLWSVTPRLATWLTSPSNILFQTILTPTSTAIELGCGTSALLGLATNHLFQKYILTDQNYVSRLVNQNITENTTTTHPKKSNRKPESRKPTRKQPREPEHREKLEFYPLDWESSAISSPLFSTPSFDIILACDCIYNEALIPPFVQTCADIARLRITDTEVKNPTIVLVAQQLRDPEVFASWLREFEGVFDTWRVPGVLMGGELREGEGFVVHVGVLKGLR